MEVGVTLEFRTPWEAEEEEEEAGEAMAHSPEEEFQLLALEMAEVEPWSNRGLVEAEVEVEVAMAEGVRCSNAHELEEAWCDRCNLVWKAAEEVEMLDSVHETTAAAAAVCKLASTVAEEGLSSNVHTTA
ncbi:hypothetical protein PanWU01x14_089770 [Parasponia andersonii]|uniref:Uncharacterized protein n=1 Tax=Parasponia andersonii TaxID=3476 RepID=A0A2P5D7J6_PARAD|nr:hypothetical protein PanWU01x14_089770 [Parasponia andersonii]